VKIEVVSRSRRGARQLGESGRIDRFGAVPFIKIPHRIVIDDKVLTSLGGERLILSTFWLVSEGGSETYRLPRSFSINGCRACQDQSDPNERVDNTTGKPNRRPFPKPCRLLFLLNWIRVTFANNVCGQPSILRSIRRPSPESLRSLNDFRDQHHSRI
jgi:hypothetical protein